MARVTGTVIHGGVTNDASPLVTGTLSAPLNPNEVVGIYRDGQEIGNASVTGSSWSYQDSGLADGASVSYQARIGNLLTAHLGDVSNAYAIKIDTAAPAQVVTVTAMSKDTGVAGDFTTSDGGAGRTIGGSLSAPLAAGDTLAVSSDGGVTWIAASVEGANWQATDAGAHAGSWQIATRIVDAAGNAGATGMRAVTLAAEPLLPQPEPAPVAVPVPQAAVPAAVPETPSAPVGNSAMIADAVAEAKADQTSLESTDLAPGEQLVSTGIPGPSMPGAGLAFLQGPAAAQSSLFEIDTGSSAFGSAGNARVLSGTDIGAGFTINVRQGDGAASGKESLRLVQAVVQIEAGLVPASDLLALSITSPNITALYDAATGTLTLSGIASAAEYEQVIQGVKLRDTAGADVKSKRTIRFTIRAESGQTQNGTKEYRGPEAASDQPAAPQGAPADGGAPAPDTIKAGKPGLLSQIARAHAKQTDGRDRLVSLAARQATRPTTSNPS
jgi:hypothetical protein